MHIKQISILFTLLFCFGILQGQDNEEKAWCIINCDPSIHTENKTLLYDNLMNDTVVRSALDFELINFPLRFTYVSDTIVTIDASKHAKIDKAVKDLNYAFRNTGVLFSKENVTQIQSEVKLEDLSSNAYQLYDTFSSTYDISDMITVFILDHQKEFCQITDNSISCSRVGGFSYILSSRANNLVLSQFDLNNPKIVAHEFGHFFGLYHTFEERLFGKDNFAPHSCTKAGDLICDTPPDPGAVYEIYVNHATCEMVGFKDKKGNKYNPILNNYMSYYKPCYLKEHIFTKDQELVIRLASRLMLRKKLSR